MAQPLAGTGSITGTVRDASGALVSDAAVVVLNLERGIRRDTKTGAHGAFAVLALEPSSGYSVKIEKAGFAQYEQTDLEVLVGEVTNLDPVLEISTQTTHVSVDSVAPVVDQIKTGVSQVVRKTQILNLPINGRRVDSYALLTPEIGRASCRERV